ncbi:MAG: hypothetical protein RLZ12_658 [Bacillota bacterium]|jgi:hypothetical protein
MHLEAKSHKELVRCFVVRFDQLVVLPRVNTPKKYINYGRYVLKFLAKVLQGLEGSIDELLLAVVMLQLSIRVHHDAILPGNTQKKELLLLGDCYGVQAYRIAVLAGLLELWSKVIERYKVVQAWQIKKALLKLTEGQCATYLEQVTAGLSLELLDLRATVTRKLLLMKAEVVKKQLSYHFFL